MKKVFVASISKTKFDAISYSADYDGIFKKIKDLGFDGIELGIRNPEEFDIDAIRGLSDRYELPVIAIATGQAYVDEGLSFTDRDEAVQRRAVERIKKHIDCGKKLGGAVVIGLIRGNPPRDEKERAISDFRRNLELCIDYAGERGVEIFIEPVNRYESSLLNTLGEAKNFVDSLKMREGVFILADTFHMNIEEASIVSSIEEVFDYLGHVHVADSNRLAPGQGHIDFDSIFRKLKELGYNRYVSAEILPLPSFDEAARLSAEFLMARDSIL